MNAGLGFGVGVVASVLLFRRKSMSYCSYSVHALGTMTDFGFILQDEAGPLLSPPGRLTCPF